METLTQEAPQRNRRVPDIDDVEPLVIGEWPLSRGEVARVSIRSFKKTWLIDIRKWFESNGQLRAGPKGISLGVKNLRRIHFALGEAIDVARARGLISAADDGDTE